MKYLKILFLVFFCKSLVHAQTCTVTISNPTPTICLGSSAVLTATGATTYSWNTGATTASISVSPTTTTVYTVTGIAGTCTQVVTTTVTVKPLPTLVISPSSPTVCFSSALTLTVSGASTYTWSTGATTTTISVTPTVNTSYTATATGTNGCVNSIVKTVTVNPNVIVTNATPSICIGSAAALVASGATTYSWSTGATTASISVSPTVTTTYTVRGTTGSCSKTLSTTVYPAAIPNVTTSSSSSSVCVGSSATITASGATTYSWSTGATITTVIVTPTVATTYTVKGTTNGCAKTVSVTITTTALPAVVISPASPTVCNGSSIVLTGSGASTYTWSTGPTTSTISVAPTVATNYTVTGTATTGCKNTAVKTVTVIDLPNTTITNPSPTVCAGTAVLLTGNNATTYTWNSGPTTQTISVTPTVTTSYTVTGKTSGCSKTATTTISVTVLPNVSITPTSPTVCAGSAITLTVNGATTYTWSTAGTGSLLTKSPITNTSYTVTGTAANGCTNTAIKTVTVNNQMLVSTTTPTICVGASATLFASGSSTYSWSTGATTTSVVVSPTVTTTYTVRGTTGACVRTLSITVLVYSLPVISFASPTTSACLGSPVVLTPTGAVNYTWSTGATTESISVTPTVTTSYTVTGVSIFGCISTKTTTVYPVCPLNYGGIGYKIKWKNYYGTKFRNDSLFKDPLVTVTEYNTSAISRNTLLSSTNGWVEAVVAASQSVDNIVGFLDSASVHYGEFYDIDFGMHLQAGTNDVYAYSAGSWIYIGPSTPGDIMRIERTGSNYIFKQNGVTRYTTAANPASILKVKAMIYGLPVYNIGVSFADTTNVYFANYVIPNVETIHTNDGTPYGMTITDGGLMLTTKLGESSYTYTWAPGGATTSSIFNKATGYYTVKVKDGLQNSSFYKYSLNYKTKWKDLNSITVKGDTLHSNAGYTWNTAISENIVTNSGDGFVRWKVQDITADDVNIVGFTQEAEPHPDYIDDITEGIYQSGNELYDFSMGSFSFIGYTLPEDELKLERIGSTIYFYRNTTLVQSRGSVSDPNVDWKIKVGIGTGSMKQIGTTWPPPFLCSSYNIQLTGPPVACKNNAKSFTAQTMLFTTAVSPAPTSNYVWSAAPTQVGSTTTGSQFNTFNILNAPNPFVLSVSNTYGTCPLSNNFNITVSNLAVNAGPDFFISSFPSVPLSGGGAPTAQGGTAPYTYNWSISPSGISTSPSPISSFNISNFIIYPIASTFGSTPYTANVTVTDGLGCTVSDDFKIYDLTVLSAQKPYAILKKKLDAGYYNTVPNPSNQTLFFMFDEEYYKPGASNNLTYTIVDNDNNQATTSPNLIKKIGDNRFALNVTLIAITPPITTGSFYKIYVKNEKDEIWQARFKVN
ncbi:MAG: hypothetical protein H0W73_17085 [Bacteroidetes bacterium]|nr:hypothetical protein [Bacteroidota bacterium]